MAMHRIAFHLTNYEPDLSPLQNGRAFAKLAGVPDVTIRSAWASDSRTFGDCHQIIYLVTAEEARKLATAYYTVPGEAGMTAEAMASDIEEHLASYGF